MLFQDDNHAFYDKGFDVDSVVDTNGAGDAFMAGYIKAILIGYSDEKACKYANAVATVIIQERGSQAATLNHEQVLCIIEENSHDK